MKHLEGTDLWVSRDGAVYQKQVGIRYNAKTTKPFRVSRLVRMGRFNPQTGLFESVGGHVVPDVLSERIRQGQTSPDSGTSE